MRERVPVRVVIVIERTHAVLYLPLELPPVRRNPFIKPDYDHLCLLQLFLLHNLRLELTCLPWSSHISLCYDGVSSLGRGLLLILLALISLSTGPIIFCAFNKELERMPPRIKCVFLMPLRHTSLALQCVHLPFKLCLPLFASPSINALSSAVPVFLSFDLMWLTTLSYAVMFCSFSSSWYWWLFLARNSRDGQHDEMLWEDIDAHGWESPWYKRVVDMKF